MYTISFRSTTRGKAFTAGGHTNSFILRAMDFGFEYYISSRNCCIGTMKQCIKWLFSRCMKNCPPVAFEFNPKIRTYLSVTCKENCEGISTTSYTWLICYSKGDDDCQEQDTKGDTIIIKEDTIAGGVSFSVGVAVKGTHIMVLLVTNLLITYCRNFCYNYKQNVLCLFIRVCASDK